MKAIVFPPLCVRFVCVCFPGHCLQFHPTCQWVFSFCVTNAKSISVLFSFVFFVCLLPLPNLAPLCLRIPARSSSVLYSALLLDEPFTSDRFTSDSTTMSPKIQENQTTTTCWHLWVTFSSKWLTDIIYALHPYIQCIYLDSYTCPLLSMSVSCIIHSHTDTVCCICSVVFILKFVHLAWASSEHDTLLLPTLHMYVEKQIHEFLHGVYTLIYKTSQLPSSNFTLIATSSSARQQNDWISLIVILKAADWVLICPVIWQVISGYQGSDEECIKVWTDQQSTAAQRQS